MNSIIERLRRGGYEAFHWSGRDGTFRDLSESPLVLTPAGPPTIDKTAHGFSLNCDTGKYLNSNAGTKFAVGTGDFSFSSWFKVRDLTVFNNIACVGWNGFATGARLYQSGGLIYASTRSSVGAEKIATNALANTFWNHVLLVRESQVLYGYLNGLAMTTPSAVTATADFAIHARTRIGADGAAAPGTYMHGYVDTILFHTIALSASDASELYGQTQPRG